MENKPFAGVAGPSSQNSKGKRIDASLDSRSLLHQTATCKFSFTPAGSQILSLSPERQANGSGNRSPTDGATLEVPQVDSLIPTARPKVKRSPLSWSLEDESPELQETSTWKPADDILQDSPVPDLADGKLKNAPAGPFQELTDEISKIIQASPFLELADEPSKAAQASLLPELTDETYKNIQAICLPESTDKTSRNVQDSLLSETMGKSSRNFFLPKLSTSTPNSESAGPSTSDEETYRLEKVTGSNTNNCEPHTIPNSPKTSKARMYLYYMSRLDKLRVLCDRGKTMTDFPAVSDEDYALLKMVIRIYGDKRWWLMMIDDLVCPDCVALLKARREDPKSKEGPWFKIKSKIRQIWGYGDDNEFVCGHDTNKVRMFFNKIGAENALRMVNIELGTNPRIPIDKDVLASAVCNVRKYLKNLRMVSITFHFSAAPVERQLIKEIVRSLAKLEALLPWHARLLIEGFEAHEECQMAWAKKSRKFWE